jgi:hypothetical protein
MAMLMEGTAIPEKLISLALRLSLWKYFVAAFVIVTMFTLLVPLNPDMPSFGLEPSWGFSMDQAVAQNLKIGKEIIFTFGPYASIYTRIYNPATDHLMVWGSAFLALCYALVLLSLAQGKCTWRLIAILFFSAGFIELRDALFLAYPLMLAACACIFLLAADSKKQEILNYWQLAAITLAFMPLGLLPLVKGSLLLICGATAFVLSTYLLYCRHRTQALLAVLVPMASAAIFWFLSGQSMRSLPSYFISMLPVISGYTEAMALPGNTSEIITYLLAATAIMWAVTRAIGIAISKKIFLSVSFALYLFIAFKSGFVRHDGHATIATNALVFAILILGLIYSDKRVAIALFASIAVWIYVDNSYINTSIAKVGKHLSFNFAGAWTGLHSRMTDSHKMQSRFEESLKQIRKEYAVPPLQGSTDIYSYDQAYLFASNNKWNPRPVMQSYSAYTLELAQLNEQHLRGINAPDNVLFRVQPMDGRLPSLEDGVSWPALFDNYTVTRLDDTLAYLRKKPAIQNSTAFQITSEGTYKTGVAVVLPKYKDPLYAQVDLRLTWLGKLAATLFKPPQLTLTLKLWNGTSKQYRVISNMMRSGFFISPFVQNTKDFVILATGNQAYLSSSAVESINIAPTFGNALLWRDAYVLKLQVYPGKPAKKLPTDFFDLMSDSAPGGYTDNKPVNCDGSIDAVNGVSPPSQQTKTSTLLQVDGWLALTDRGGLAPDDVFVTLRNRSTSEHIRYIITHRMQRNDVKEHFKRPEMPDIGFTSAADIGALNGDYLIGLARMYKGRLEHCAQFNIPIKIGAPTSL